MRESRVESISKVVHVVGGRSDPSVANEVVFQVEGVVEKNKFCGVRSTFLYYEAVTQKSRMAATTTWVKVFSVL